MYSRICTWAPTIVLALGVACGRAVADMYPVNYQGQIVDRTTGLPPPDGTQFSVSFQYWSQDADANCTSQGVAYAPSPAPVIVTTYDGQFSATYEIDRNWLWTQFHPLFLEVSVTQLPGGPTETFCPRSQVSFGFSALSSRFAFLADYSGVSGTTRGIEIPPEGIDVVGSTVGPMFLLTQNGSGPAFQVGGSSTFLGPAAFNAVGLPFTVASSTLVPNLNVQYLSGRTEAFLRDAGNLNAGILPNARLSGSYTSELLFANTANTFVGNGTLLTGLSASNVTTGTLPSGRLSGNYSGTVAFSSAANSFAGSGAGLTSLNASSISTGALADARLSTNVALLGATQIFTGVNTFNAAGNVFSGSGAGLTGLSAGNISSGTLNDSRLSTNVARRNAGQTMTGANTFTLNSTGTSPTVTINRSGYVGEFGPSALDVSTDDQAATAISASATVAGSVGVSVSSQGTGINAQTLGSTGQAGYFLNGSATNTGAAVQIMSMGAPVGSNGALSAICTNGRAAYFQNADPGTYALRARSTAATTDCAGWFEGRVQITGDCNVNGTLSKTAGSFKIDHPLDPENKFLYHSFVESPDMMNVYNGNIVTDERGYATVQLPDWFEALNRDFRYQLTVIDEQDSDGFVQAKIVRGVKGNQFTLRTSAPRAAVSWQVTGIRQDAYALAHPIPVEVDKTPSERGRYQFPELFGMPAELKLDAEGAVSPEDGE